MILNLKPTLHQSTMTALPQNFECQLRFTLDPLAPEDYFRKWLEFKRDCESGERENIFITLKVISKLKHPRNQELSKLKRAEGGIGFDNSNQERQIRYRYKEHLHGRPDNDILFDRVQGDWTIGELADIIKSFIYIANLRMGEECVSGQFTWTSLEE